MLHHITLHLARSKQFPEGSSRYGYEITAPLDGRRASGSGGMGRESGLTAGSAASGPTRASGRVFWSIGRAGPVERPG